MQLLRINKNVLYMTMLMSGKLKDHLKQELKEMQRLQEMLIADITESSLVTEEALRDYILRKAEWYIPADEAISLKLANGYYK